MGLKKTEQPETKAAPVGVPVSYTNATIRRAEELRNHHTPRNIQAITALEHATGYAHICCSTNADVCAMQNLRLYRRVTKAGGAERRRFGTKRLETRSARMKYLTMGAAGAGVKAAGIAESGGDIEEVTKHSILDLLAQPNPLAIGMHEDWLRFYMKWMTGNAYWMIGERDGTNGPPVTMLPLLPQFVHVNADSVDFVANYRYGRSETDAMDLEPGSVLHFKHRPSRFTPLYGEGAMSGVVAEAQLIIDNLMYDLAFVEHGHMPPAIISVDAEAQDSQVEGMYNYLRSKLSGIRGKMEYLVLRGANQVHQLTQTPKDLMTIEKIERAEKKIRAAFGHTESMADSNASTYASAVVGFSEQYLGAVIRPAINMDADELEALLPLFGLDPTVYFFAYDDPVPREAQRDEERMARMVSAGLLTVNEARRELEYEVSDDENADKLLVNGQELAASSGGMFGGLFGGAPIGKPVDEVDDFETIVEGDDVQQVPQQKIEETALNGAQIAQLVELARQVGSGEIAREAALAIAEAAFPGIPSEKVRAIFSQLHEAPTPQPVADEGDAEASEESDAEVAGEAIDAGDKKADPSAWAAVDARMKSLEADRWNETKYAPCGCGAMTKDDDIAVNQLLEEALRQYAPQIRDSMRDVIADMQDDALRAVAEGREPDLDLNKEQAVRVITEPMREVVSMGLRNVLEAGNADPGMFDVVPQRALAFLETHIPQLADDIAETTTEMARVAVQAGVEQGLSIDDIAERISGVPEYRAERIARTEVQDAVQAGKMEGFKELGVEQVNWVNAPGATEAHQIIASRSPKPIGEPFVKAGESLAGEDFKRDIYRPPARPNCRCDLQAVLGDE